MFRLYFDPLQNRRRPTNQQDDIDASITIKVHDKTQQQQENHQMMEVDDQQQEQRSTSELVGEGDDGGVDDGQDQQQQQQQSHQHQQQQAQAQSQQKQKQVRGRGKGRDPGQRRQIICELDYSLVERNCNSSDTSYHLHQRDHHHRYPMFRVIKAKGKALYTGGFGIPITSTTTTTIIEPSKEKERSEGNHEAASNDTVESTTENEDDVLLEQQRDGDNDNDHAVRQSKPTTTCLDEEEEEDGRKGVDPNQDSSSSLPPARTETNYNEDLPTQNSVVVPKKTTPSATTATPTVKSKITADYLFIEEVVFLHERGILEARVVVPPRQEEQQQQQPQQQEDVVQQTTTTTRKTAVLDTSQLYQLLPRFGVSLSMYLTYSHLCGQDFRVLRHDPKRLQILIEQQQQKEKEKEKDTKKKTDKQLENVGEDGQKSEQDETMTGPDQQEVIGENQTDVVEKQIQVSDTVDGDNKINEKTDNEKTETTTTTTTKKKSMKQVATELRKRVRESIQTAPVPCIPQDGLQQQIDSTTTNKRKLARPSRKAVSVSTTDTSTSEDDGDDNTMEDIDEKDDRKGVQDDVCEDDDDEDDAIRICWDCYIPNSHFGKTKPGLPDFFVAVTHYNIPLVKVSDLTRLLFGSCYDFTGKVKIPLKVATVSDSGTVVMFGVTDFTIPDNGTTNDEDNDDEEEDDIGYSDDAAMIE